MNVGVRQAASKVLIKGANIRRGLDSAGGAVALTFDDGPDPRYTVEVLDELARLGIRATFFLVGEQARANPSIVRRMVADGHDIGSHSCSHPEPWRLGLRDLMVEYRRGRSLVEHAAEQTVRLFRPPKGYVSAKGALAMLAARVRPWLWTIDPCDWEPNASAQHIVAGCSNLAAGDVVLLHDAIKGPLAPSALDRSATCASLSAIAALARSRQLRFTTLTQS
jgi:peptidoglycan/xylan/chitin deacetylase (PgdA/CDA1 family)